MTIHTVSYGDTIFKIARKYSVQPTKIIEDNGLEGDRLTIGQELIILTPTRTVTVRGGDTLASISRRFGVRRSSLLSNNPALLGDSTLRPGHILSVKFDTPLGGTSSAVGFFGRFATEKKLKLTLPYLTYIIFEAYDISDCGLKKTFDFASAHALCKRSGKISLLGFEDKTDGDFLRSENSATMLDEMIGLAKKSGFGGIMIKSNAKEENTSLLSAFLMEARKRLIGCDLILFGKCGLDGSDTAELCDGAILDLYENNLFDSQSYNDAKLSLYSETCASEKTFVTLPTLAKIKDDEMSVYDAWRLAERVGAQIFKNEDLVCYFDYTRYTRGRGENVRVMIPSASMTKAKLGKIKELGFMGIAFDINSVPVWLLSMFNTYFSRADYSLLFT